MSQVLIPAVPGQRVVAYVNNLGLMQGTLKSINIHTAEIWFDGIERPLSADPLDVALETTWDAMLEAGWQLDRLYYQFVHPETKKLLTIAAAAAEFERLTQTDAKM